MLWISIRRRISSQSAASLQPFSNLQPAYNLFQPSQPSQPSQPLNLLNLLSLLNLQLIFLMVYSTNSHEDPVNLSRMAILDMT